MSVGSVGDAARFHVAAVSDLLNGYSVGLSGDTNMNIAAVVTASLGEGGSADNLAPGVQFFNTLSSEGGLGSRPATATFAWNYLLSGIPHLTPSATVAGYDVQAINRDAPHPAAARLWEEFLFSDGGQNLCVIRGARPARIDAMRSEGAARSGSGPCGDAQPCADGRSPRLRRRASCRRVRAVTC
jgi:putative spermidine/putrescine transport system substrate-binding protein